MTEFIGNGQPLNGRAREAYLNCLSKESVPPRNQPYYVVRLNQFIKASAGSDPKLLDEHKIQAILTTFGRRDNLTDWQFAQLVDAVRIYFVCYLHTSAASRVDWSYWKNSSRSVNKSHSSTARESRPEELVRQKVRQSKGGLSQVRQQHEELIVRFVTDIRARGYAYRTEQVYEQWVCRYILFCDGISPEEAGADAVVNFLNELVVSNNVSASTQNQALNALIFLYQNVLHMPLGQLENLARSKRAKTVPVVMTRQEVKRLLAELGSNVQALRNFGNYRLRVMAHCGCDGTINRV